ncbi:MAG: hypothetical protein K8J08_00145 [Thermoanaerobaculia bacterium]|nr:hypothetical protein [Thermoanaerobaculia bacterium]
MTTHNESMTRTLLLAIVAGPLLLTAPAVSQIGFATDVHGIHLLDPPYASVINELGFYPGPIAFSPEGQLFVVERSPLRRLHRLDSVDGTPTLVGDFQPPPEAFGSTDLTFLADGRLFMIASLPSNQTGLYSIDPTTGLVSLVTAIPGRLEALAGRGLSLFALSVEGYQRALQEIDPMTGEMTPTGVEFTPVNYPGLGGPFFMDFSGDDRILVLRPLSPCFGCSEYYEHYTLDVDGEVDFGGLVEGPIARGFAVAPPPPYCLSGPNQICLHDRFLVSTTWSTPQGEAGPGHPLTLGESSAGFWFFEPGNFEVLVKVLDACAPPWNRYWVFASGLTDVETTVTVDDLESGQSWGFENPQNQPFPPIQDTDAFATCP